MVTSRSYRTYPYTNKVDSPLAFFARYDTDQFYIMTDTDSSFCSIHQALEGDGGKPAVVANGNAIDAGACLAISWEAKMHGVKRGLALTQAKLICPNLTVYTSCLPLYELYAKATDEVFSWILSPNDTYRASNDEVTISVHRNRYPYWHDFLQVLSLGESAIREHTHMDFKVHYRESQLPYIQSLSPFFQGLLASAHLLRQSAATLLGIPISVTIAPTISLAKSLMRCAKPSTLHGQKCWRTRFPGIAFPVNREDAIMALRPMKLTDLCGIGITGIRLNKYGIKTVQQVQDTLDPDSIRALVQNLHQAKVIWSLCHGRDDTLPGYLSAIRDRKPPPNLSIGKGHTLYGAPQSITQVWQLISESCHEIGVKLLNYGACVKEIFLAYSGYNSESPHGRVSTRVDRIGLKYPVEVFKILHDDPRCHQLTTAMLPYIRRVQVSVECRHQQALPLFQDEHPEKQYHVMQAIREKLGVDDIIGLGYELRSGRIPTYTPKRSSEILRARSLLKKNALAYQLCGSPPIPPGAGKESRLIQDIEWARTAPPPVLGNTAKKINQDYYANDWG